METVRRLLQIREQTFDVRPSSDYFKKLMQSEDASIIIMEMNFIFKGHLFNTALSVALYAADLMFSMIFPLYPSFTQNFILDLLNISVIVILIWKFLMIATVISFRNEHMFVFWIWLFKVQLLLNWFRCSSASFR